MRIVVVQYAGDYLQAYKDIYERNVEIYHAHRYAMDSLARIGKEFGEAAFLCCRTSARYNTVLPSGLRVMGAAADPYRETEAVVSMLAAHRPTHIAIHAPMPGVIRWSIANRVKTMALFANYFPNGGLRRRIRNFRLKRMLNDPRVEWVANHNVDACRSTADIGVEPDKIVPWDWPHSRSPSDHEPKRAERLAAATIVYVGLIEEAKGVGDIIDAIAGLKSRGVMAHAKIAGQGEIEKFAEFAAMRGVGESVDFLGLIPNDAVVPLMRAADLVVVPSRHHYPEGLPLTIYEAFCSRTPLIASDHPMFRNKLADRVNALIFPAGRPAALAARIRELMVEPDLYARLSENSQQAWERLQVPVKWGDLIERWVQGGADARDWLWQHRLASGRYARPPPGNRSGIGV